MREQWAKVRLDDLTEQDSPITYGVIKPGDEGTVRFVRGGDISDGCVLIGQLRTITAEISEQYSRTLLRGGELLMCLVGQPGQVAIAPDTLAGANIARQVGLIRLRSEFNAEFIKYFLQSPDGQESLGAHTGGSVQQVINLGDLRTVEIPLPSPAEQQRIVAILDEAFAGIATARAAAEQNRQNARALFESHLQTVFSQPGEGWVEKNFADVCEISSALVDPRKAEFLDLLHVGGANIESKTGGLLELKTAREEGLISGKFIFDESMVLYSKIRPYLMKVARPDFRGLCSADIYPLSAKQGQVDRDYLFHLLLSPAFTDYANAGSARAGMPKVNRDHLFAYRCYFPPVEKQAELAALLDELHEETQNLEALYQRKLEALDKLKQSLLHQAFSGEL
ncbi:restriction endonuclease subunit S [Uliginosibacterium sp. 31-12]|uniref:restriction endonuclease subunit S n=1 Tax=Uliginosibacterium sp. 31-12 TaxID=3062781 RepID=UPI0026E307A3|nr:restriction endonuclease subunit S [Uliginosibacterium sp. 31-12]MDO6384686.1 restriction endonuclease subunit S [Uliginosibacterium sp. 31-12]